MNMTISVLLPNTEILVSDWRVPKGRRFFVFFFFFFQKVL